jgi:cytochrome d ubiquinol oxidase subunit I
MTAEMLSRIQFGLTIGFHILFPTLNLGLALFLTCMEAAWLKTKNPLYLKITKFWTKVFALTFGMGVVSGVVMSYEIGTNFAGYSYSVGPVLGSLFAYEVLSAFFLEAGFLGIMLFGWNRVGARVHFAATFLVMLGTTISAFWILSANSWMQTPTGYDFVNGRFTVTDWFAVILNPSAFIRFLHMIFASYITTCFVVAGVSAYYLLQNRHLAIAQKCLASVLLAAAVIVPLQIFVGDTVGLKVLQYQPIKTAAIEGVWHTQKGAPLVLFAYPDETQERNLYELSIPYGASLINTHHLDGELQGLTSVPRADRPVVPTVFYSFRIMLGLGVIFFLLAYWALFLHWRKTLYQNKLFLRACVLAAPLGFVATIAGWMVAESGRQPWVVYNLLRTSEAVSPHIRTHEVIISLSAFVVVYGIVFSFYLLYLFRTLHKGPDNAAPSHEENSLIHLGRAPL